MSIFVKIDFYRKVTEKNRHLFVPCPSLYFSLKRRRDSWSVSGRHDYEDFTLRIVVWKARRTLGPSSVLP